MYYMAKKGNRNSRSGKGMSKIEPSVQTLTFAVQGIPQSTNQAVYIDLSQVASLYNRRFYRQGLNWAVAGFKFLTGGPQNAGIIVSKAPNTWITSNSWEKGMRTWSRMIDEAASETQEVKPRFMDFKVYLDSQHHQQGSAANLLPRDLALNTATPGVWDYSTVQIPDATNLSADVRDVDPYDIILIGGSYPGVSASTGRNAVSLIEGYAAGRALPNIVDPNTPDDMRDTSSATPENWAEAIFNDGMVQDSEVLRDMQTQNELAPYPFENDGTSVDTRYPGGANQLSEPQIHSWEYVTSTTVGSTTYVKGGNFPCGLIRIDLTNQDPPTGQLLDVIIQLDLVPGQHRGYLAESMTEM